MTGSVLVRSLGCDKNLVDTEKMMGLLRAEGYTFTDDAERAQIALVNTCCFIHDAKTESVREILSLADLKQSGSLECLIVTGCLAERYREEIREEIPEVDAVIGTASVDRIVSVIRQARQGQKPVIFEDINRAYKMTAGRVLTTGGHYAFLKIAEGCDKHCTYCIIPSLRGRFRSVPEDDLVEEARQLASKGVKELILVAQETTRYGLDLKGKSSLAHLLKRLCDEVDGPEWIRVLYCYPEEIGADLIAVMRDEKKIVPYLDIPVQSGSDRILKRMGRGVTNAGIRALVQRLREEIPDICLRTTLISGFPGESAADHRESMALVEDLRFDRLGVFTYSAEEGTAAYRMREQVPEPLKKRRRTQLMKLQQRIAFAETEALCGRVLRVMIEGRVTEADDDDLPEGNVYVGRTWRDAPDVDGYIFVRTGEKELMTGDFVNVRVTATLHYDLLGELA